MKKVLRYILTAILIITLAGGTGLVVWASNAAQPETQALESLQAFDGVAFEQVNDWLVFTPKDSQPSLGLIFYPGGRVDHRAYAPHARAIAAEGFTVVIVPMPLNLAFLGINRAEDVIATYPEIPAWVIGGHSLGGAMAAEFIRNNPDQIKGLVLWAAYPGGNNDLTVSNLAILSVYADNDGLATLEDIADSRARLPESTVFVEVSGGNHAGFGWYGAQNRDGKATLSKTEQQDLIVQATVAFLQMIERQ